MNHYQDNGDILNLISQPAFRVHEGKIAQCNDAALRLFISPGTPVAQLLAENTSEYDHFADGCLFLSIYHNDAFISASVSRIGDDTIFILSSDEEHKELKTLSLTAVSMRQPLSAMIASANSLSSVIQNTGNKKTKEQFERMNRNLHQIHRMLCNMSDAVLYANGVSRYMLTQNVTSILDDIFQKVQELAAYNKINFQYSLPQECIFCCIDEQLLERSIYNMISNAFKFTPEGGTIYAKLLHRGNRLYISVEDNGSGIPPEVIKDVFQRYQRPPGLEDSRFGLGLGLFIVRSAARIHNGTVLIDQPNGSGTRITMSIPIRQGATLVHSDASKVDYAGGWDHSLLELSDVLPTVLYGHN